MASRPSKRLASRSAAIRVAVPATEPARLDLELQPDDLLDDDHLYQAVARLTGMGREVLRHVEIERRGLDARHGRVRVPVRLALYRQHPPPTRTLAPPVFPTLIDKR